MANLNTNRTLEPFAETIISDPTARESIYFSTDDDEQPWEPQFFHGLLAALILGMPVVAVVVAMVGLTHWRFGL